MALALDEIIKNFSVTKEKRGSAYNMTSAHYHDHYEIYYLSKGNVRYFIEDKIYDLNEGDLILIPPHAIHKTATLMNKSAERILVCFTNEFLMYPPNDGIFSCFDIRFFKTPQVRELIEKIEKEYSQNDKYSEELIAGYIREILVILTRSVEKTAAGSVSYNNSIVQNAVYYISENYHKELSLCNLSREFAISESHFSRQFKAYTGFGLNEYISLVRIKNAEKLLTTTNMTITDIAQTCGFNSSSYFAAVFKKVRGHSPMYVRSKRRRDS